MDLRAVLYPEVGDGAAGARASDRLGSMRVSQTALFAVEYSLARLWQSWEVTPQVVLGHSLGAYAAATVAGVLSLPDAVTLVLERSRLLDSLPAGAMLAVALPERELEPLLTDDVSIAAVNGPAQCVVTGPAADVDTLHARLVDQGAEANVLRISAAAHSVLVETVAAEFEDRVAQVTLNPPAIPWISDTTGSPVTDRDACDPAYWRRHLRHTVRFADAMSTLLGSPEWCESALVEMGPGQTLSALARRHPGYRADHVLVSSLPHPADPADSAAVAMGAVGRLWQAGVPISWARLHDGARRLRTPLPTYPFDRRRFRLGPGDTDPGSSPEMPAPKPISCAPAIPDGDAKQVVAAAFADVLGLSEVGTDDSFFDLGGDSLMAARLITAVRRTLGAELTVGAIFRAPTPAQLAAVIDTVPEDDSAPKRQQEESA
ncbi:acyltransferase domain-containing protein [Rhodococcus sp. WS4]|nr:acyltransferase domain-containing protein [Rhodococcus sp. WS4]